MRRRLWLLLVIGLLVSGCGESGPALKTKIALTGLPEGIGRGFPVVSPRRLDQEVLPLEKGSLAPNFHMVLADGQYLSLADLQGQPVLINFWATWCSPCREEMPELLAAAHANPELVLLAVNVQEELARLEPFAVELGMSVPVLQDPTGDLRTRYGVRGLPTTIFIDRTGHIATIWQGQLTPELLAQQLAALQ